MKYDEIARVNEEMVRTDLKAKKADDKRLYAEVPQRVQAFRKLYPEGYINTELVSNDAGLCIFKARVGFVDEYGHERTLGTGYAYEKEGSSYINKTSYIENCETSAVGRALGFLGLGSETSIASYEEVTNAKEQQAFEKEAEKVEERHKESQRRLAVQQTLKAVIASLHLDAKEVAKEFGLSPNSTAERLEEVIEELGRRQKA